MSSNRYPCVFPVKRNGEIYRYVVKVTHNRERVYVGCYKSKEEAIHAHKLYMTKHAAKINPNRSYRSRKESA